MTESASSRPSFASALSTEPDPLDAARAAADRVQLQLGGRSPTVAVLFATPELCDEAAGMADEIQTALSPEHMIGAMTETPLSGARELEDAGGLSLWAAHLPGVTPAPLRLLAVQEDDDRIAVVDHSEIPLAEASPALLVADPFTFPVDALLAQMNRIDSPPTVVGGLASGGRGPGEHVLFSDGGVVREGAVGVALVGAEMTPVVSQGCAPIGPEMVITDAEGAVIHALAGTPATAKLDSVLGDLTDDERELARGGLLAGLVINENQPDYERGDFLIRGIHGADPEQGALVIGEQVRIGQTLRFHVRDAGSATEDLDEALTHAREALDGRAAGALVFTCNGRGTRMFGAPDHDAAAVSESLSSPALAGMFCNGEIGPVGGKNFLHGFTATMAVFSS
jgi:small ligand-binding sensory domain FIST